MKEEIGGFINLHDDVPRCLYSWHTCSSYGTVKCVRNFVCKNDLNKTFEWLFCNWVNFILEYKYFKTVVWDRVKLIYLVQDSDHCFQFFFFFFFFASDNELSVYIKGGDFFHCQSDWPIPMAARSKACVCGRSLAGIAGSNLVWGMDVSLLWVFVLSGRGLEESYRVLCVWVCSWSLDNGVALAHWGRGGRGREGNLSDYWFLKRDSCSLNSLSLCFLFCNFLWMPHTVKKSSRVNFITIPTVDLNTVVSVTNISAFSLITLPALMLTRQWWLPYATTYTYKVNTCFLLRPCTWVCISVQLSETPAWK